MRHTDVYKLNTTYCANKMNTTRLHLQCLCLHLRMCHQLDFHNQFTCTDRCMAHYAACKSIFPCFSHLGLCSLSSCKMQWVSLVNCQGQGVALPRQYLFLHLPVSNHDLECQGSAQNNIHVLRPDNQLSFVGGRQASDFNNQHEKHAVPY